MSPTVQLYGSEDLASIPWPETPDGLYARAYLEPFLRESSTPLIENVQTTCMVLLIDGQIVLPLTVNEQEYGNSYVCSPYSHYVTYAREELVLIPRRWLRQGLALLIDAFGLFCRSCNINRVVHVNNWLLSTNLYPALTGEQVTAVLSCLRSRFPNHALVFRSLSDYANADLLQSLRQAGCLPVPSRQIYVVQPSDPSASRAKARWLIKRDLALLERHGYTVVTGEQLTQTDLPRLVELYNELYLEKYSTNNPMFTTRFLRVALEHQTLHLVALRREGRIDAVLGYFCRQGIMTTPVFGYDTGLPRELGLYRMLSAVLWQIARENGHTLHSSSGAAEFKRNRGAVASIEYSAVYQRHLSWSRRLCWSLLSGLLVRVGVPLLQRYKL